MAVRDASMVTVIIATYNSSAKLRMVLTALRSQDYPKQKLEILVVDGRSTDDTRAVGEEFGARIVDNPKTLPGWAKFIALREARGRYAIYLDSDEVLLTSSAISNIYRTFQEQTRVHLVATSGYHSPDGYPFINQYINEFGDPFSCFIYRLSKDYRFFIPTMKRRYSCSLETDHYAIFDLSNTSEYPLIEMYAMGAAMDLDYFEREFPEAFNSETEFSHAFNIIIGKAPFLGIAKGSDILHYSSESRKVFLSKVNWRIRNNIFFPEMADRGFLGRMKHQRSMAKLKKYLYLPYCFLILPVALDSIWLAISRRNLGYLSHFYFSLHTAFSIVGYYGLSALGWKPEINAYGSSTKVSATNRN